MILPRITVKFTSVALVWMWGCADEPTAALRLAESLPRYALVDGPVTPLDGGFITSAFVSVGGNRDQNAASVSGDLVCFTDTFTGEPQVRYFNVSSGAVGAVREEAGENQGECDVDQSRIVFSHLSGGNAEISVFDVSTSVLNTLDAQQAPGVDRVQPSIGSSTVAFLEEFDVGGVRHTDLRIADLANLGELLVVTEKTIEIGPRVSPDGKVVVWEECPSWQPVDCNVMKLEMDGSSVGAPALVASTPRDVHADTDGSYIVYDADLPSATGRDIYIQAVSGGPVTQLAIAGDQTLPRVSGGVVAFIGPVPQLQFFEVFVYVIATNTLFRVSTAGQIDPDGSVNGLADVSVLPLGGVRVAWTGRKGNPGDDNVYVATFTPVEPPTSRFGGFMPPVDGLPTVNVTKAGAAVPVKFSLGGDRGLNIFAAGSPSSVTVACNSSAPTGEVEETVTAGSSSLTYDITSDTYTYIWKTNKTWANTCRRLTLRFTDGTVADADFQFLR